MKRFDKKNPKRRNNNLEKQERTAGNPEKNRAGNPEKKKSSGNMKRTKL